MPSYSLDTTASGRVRLALHGTKAEAAVLHTLDVAQYRGILRTVTTSKDDKTGDCIIEVDHWGTEQGSVEVEGDKLVWSFDVPRNKVTPIIGRVTRTVAREDEDPNVQKVLTSIHQDEDGSAR